MPTTDALHLPRSVARLITANEHPGLALDKYVAPSDQEEQRYALDRVVDVTQQAGQPERCGKAFEAARHRRSALLGSLGTTRWRMCTAAPLALHLSRASALENAGICLHRPLGFAYIPATALKGLARAYAILAEGKSESDETFVRVFGTSGRAARSGGVVFHDAWPTSWPRLVLDIANSHHRDYYGGTGAPGDWEHPVPVNFLTVAKGTEFELALSARRAEDRELVPVARRWLEGGLVHLGVGAKTASGYGWMRPSAEPPPAPDGWKHNTEVEVELVSPAFYAGASPKNERDCTLRPATLRGLLRWWWRTMHVGFLTIEELLALEGLIWGSTPSGQGMIHIQVERLDDARPRLVPYRPKGYARPSDWNNSFLREHGIAVGDKGPPLAYAAYGMADGGQHRYCLEPGARFRIRIIARGRRTESKRRWTITATQAWRQAEASLRLLLFFGGTGAKSRKGFGSLRQVSEPKPISVEEALRAGKALRDELGIDRPYCSQRAAGSLSLGNLAGPEVVVDAPWNDAWRVLNAVGTAMQNVASDWKHKQCKVALGLPRQIHGPARKPLRHQDPKTHQPPEKLRGARSARERHASPVTISLGRRSDGNLQVRALAFVATLLRSEKESREVLSEYLRKFEEELRRAFERGSEPPTGPRGHRGGLHSPRSGGRPHGHPGGLRHGSDRTRTTAPTGGLRTGDVVEVVLLEEKTKKGGWKARHEPSGRVGPVQGTPPPDVKAGDVVRVVIKSLIRKDQADWAWPTKGE